MSAITKSLAAIAACALAIALTGINPSSAADNPVVNTGQLLDEMVNLERLTKPSSSAYQTRLFCSYDRASQVISGPGWFANLDGPGQEEFPTFLEVLEKPDADKIGRYLVADVEGPGSIVRTQTAAMTGALRLILDDSPKPLYDGPAQAFLHFPYPEIAKQAGIQLPHLQNTFVGQKTAAYCPIPFAKHCRIEWTGSLDDFHFYQIEIRRYASGTKVETFSENDLKRFADNIAQTHEILSNPDTLASAQTGDPREISITIAPNKVADLLKLEMPEGGMLTCLTMKVESEDIEEALRGIVLSGTFDGAARPQIEAPIGDFFGSGPGVNPFRALPFEVRPDGTMICRFPMPFEKSASFSLENFTDKPARIIGQARVRPEPRMSGAPLVRHFYAHWRVDHGLRVGGMNRHFDLPYVLANGRGRYVGCAISLMVSASAMQFTWWGEGDQKTYVDDDVFPTFFGNGTEDFFNYSWCKPDLFSTPFSNQSRVDGPDNCGFNANARWNIVDDIPFEKRLHFYMELWSQARSEGFSYARITYLYAEPGLRDDHIPITPDNVRLPKVPDPLNDQDKKNPLVFQMEDLNGAEGHIVRGPRWSNGAILSWSPTKEGEEMTLTFESPHEGIYHLSPVMVLSPESGRFGIKVNGETIIESHVKKEWQADLYTPHHTMLRKLWGPEFKLATGFQTLTLISRGANPNSRGTTIAGDFFILRKQQTK